MGLNYKALFTNKLVKWYTQTKQRQLPWRNERDPYKIWLSEIILQQTRVQQGLPYFERFVESYPSVDKLAEANDEEVFKLWEGLGYYNRCKNLLHSARYIHHDLKGNFPTEYADILKLKGVGVYTAAAISSFAFGLPHAVIDGNVYRVLSRYFGDATPIDSKKGILLFSKLAQDLLYKTNTALYNQAIMDFGATVCKPQIPECVYCVMKSQCLAYNKGWVNILPVKEKQTLRKERWFYYFVFNWKGSVLVNKRVGKDIWQSLFEFHLIEAGKPLLWNAELVKTFLFDQLSIKKFILNNISKVYKQQLTHQNIKAQFISIELAVLPDSLKNVALVKWERLRDFALPKVINNYLDEITL